MAAAIRPDMADFDRMTLMNIGLFKNNTEECIWWLRRYGLLASVINCTICNLPCNKQNKDSSIDSRMWRCMVKRCKQTFSIRRGSFFERSHLKLWQILALTEIWVWSAGSSRGMSYNQMQHELEIGCLENIVDWNQYCRDIAVNHFLNNPEQLGGPGCIVEIDESLFARQKYNQGRVVAEQWIFGGYEPATKRGFLVPVQRRDAATLLPIIGQWVRPGSVVWNDMWAAYNGIAAQGLLHRTVNHTYHFVDPNTGVTTNRSDVVSGQNPNLKLCMARPIASLYQIISRSLCGNNDTKNMDFSTSGIKFSMTIPYKNVYIREIKK